MPEEKTAKKGPIRANDSQEIEDLLSRLLRHESKNRFALLNSEHEDYKTAHHSSGLFYNQLANLFQKFGKGEEGPQGSEIIRRYRDAAADHFKKAGFPSGVPTKGIGNMDYQERRAVVEDNRKLFEAAQRRRIYLDEIQQLKGRLRQYDKKDPRMMAKLHRGIFDRLIYSTVLTNQIGDFGKNGIPKAEEFGKEADYHGDRHDFFNKKARQVTEKTTAAKRIRAQKEYSSRTRKV